MNDPQPNETRTAIDGPRDKPNGILKVHVVSADPMGMYTCQVLAIISANSKTARIGDRIQVHRDNFIA